RCKASIEVSVSCMVINCRLLCGASFHMCKEDEHSLLCPNEKVPCLNAHYGCPFTMCHSRLAKHLEVCPASVVCCSMEWNRWPLENPDAPLYTNLLKELHEQESLDLSMALRDQKHLCLMAEQEEEPAAVEEYDDEEEAVGKETVCNGMHVNGRGGSGGGLVNGPSKACEKALKEDVVLNSPVDKDKYNLFEKMFSMEMGGCKQAEDGVLERLGQEVKPRKFNMYIVHHGRMLISFGQMDACTPRERDFVYGKLEPIPVQTLRSFKVPSSYKQRRIQLREFNTRVMTEHKGVGTSDLDRSKKDGGEMDEMFSTLLCYAEVEIRGHKISETVATDGLYVDIATQTYNFATAPFKSNATLTEITAGRDLKLHIDLDTEADTLRHNKSTSAFTFLCGHFFLRDEFASHFKNVHLDIQSSLSGWFEQRCPLAYLGCTFSQRRLQPSTHRAKVSYNQDLSIFTLTPEVPASLMSDSQTVPLKAHIKYEDSLSNLPFEVLCHIISYLDSFTLSQLSLVSRLFRDICATLLQERGMVGFKWRKKSHGGTRWKPTKVWEFRTLFSKVGNWALPSMAEHLKHCPFYQTELKTEPFALASMLDYKGKERHSLVSLFMRRK
uniref:F-box protein 40, tandem duplicate 2 n=1 Tax=Sinocyclocheilus rhinocerous TaxID=307959 RepID=A0A673KIV3_9TELE